MKTPEKRASRAAYMRDYTARNRERVCAQRRARYQENPDHVLSAQREYNARPDIKARMREYNAVYYSDPLNRESKKLRESKPLARAKKQEQDRIYHARVSVVANAKKLAAYRADPLKTIDRNREWRHRNPEKVLARNQRRRAVKMLVVVESVAPSVIYERDGGVCRLCRKPVSRQAMTLDHVIPLSKRGPHTEANLQLAHRSCNSSKGTKILSTNIFF